MSNQIEMAAHNEGAWYIRNMAEKRFIYFAARIAKARRPFGHRVHTICRPYEKTGRPVRRLRIPCGLLKQLLRFSLLLPFPPIVPSSTATRRVPVPKSSTALVSPVPPTHPGNYLSPSLCLSFLSDRKSTRFQVIEARQRAIDCVAAARRLLIHAITAIGSYL